MNLLLLRIPSPVSTFLYTSFDRIRVLPLRIPSRIFPDSSPPSIRSFSPSSYFPISSLEEPPRIFLLLTLRALFQRRVLRRSAYSPILSPTLFQLRSLSTTTYLDCPISTAHCSSSSRILLDRMIST